MNSKSVYGTIIIAKSNEVVGRVQDQKCLFIVNRSSLDEISLIEVKPNQNYPVMTNAGLNLPKIDDNRSCSGSRMVSGSLELAKFWRHAVTSIELADKWQRKCNFKAVSVNFRLVQAES